MKNTKKVAAIALAVPTLVFGTGITASADRRPPVSDAEFADQLQTFAIAHPGDTAGLEALAKALGGEAETTTATMRTDEVPGAVVSSRESQSAVSPMADFPQDVFTVNLTRSSIGEVKILTGSFDWRNNFAGQSEPFDIAALRFSSGCGTMSDLNSTTRNLRGESTDRTSLREAGVGTNAPIWNVDAITSGFENQADVGVFQAQYDTTNCAGTPVQAAFDYEGNQGGSITSVSASWGGLSIGYSNPGLVLKKSTPPITL